MELKRCTRCGTEKSSDQFHKDKTRTDGLFPHCKSCKTENKRKYYQENKDRIDAKTKEWCRNNPDKRREIQRAYVERNHEEILEKSREKWRRNPEHFRAMARRKYYKHRDAKLRRQREYYTQHPDRKRIVQRKHYMKHHDEILQKQHEWYLKNRDVHAERVRRWGQRNPERKLAIIHKRRAAKYGNGGSYTKQQWQELKEKFDYTCLRCGLKEPFIKLTIDHIVPLSKGGTNDIGNIQPLCGYCNQSKHTNTADYRGDWKSEHKSRRTVRN